MGKKKWEQIEWLLFIIAIILVLLLSASFVYTQGIINGGNNLVVLGLIIQILPNLIASLIVVISIYVFLTSRGIDINEQFRDEIISSFVNKIKTEISPKNIDSLVERIAAYKGNKFLRLEYSKEIFRFSEKLKTAKSIWMNGYSCARLFQEFKSEMERALLNGTNIRIIITDPNSAAVRLMEERDVHPGRVVADINYVVSEINTIKDVIAKSTNKNIGSIEIKFITWLPSISMILYNPDEQDGELKIKVYPAFYSTNHFNPTDMLIDIKNYPDQFAYFREQYNRLWNREISSHDVKTD